MATVQYGSDLVVDVLERLGITCATLNPGASFRGLHESLVHSGLIRPVLCLSEGVVVAAAHGYGKAANRPMAALLHNLVGLQNGALGLFNAWIDQAPVMAIGGSGPADSTLRRPYIDWIHTARPQAAAVRDHIKWDDEPASIQAITESLVRAYHLATSAPVGPTYVAIDAVLQEMAVEAGAAGPISLPRPPRIALPQPDLERVAALLDGAERPVVLADHVGRSEPAYDALIQLTDRIGARVVDLGGRHSFPNTHPADATGRRTSVLQAADLVLALDVRDLTWALTEVDVGHRTVTPLVSPEAVVVSIGLGDLLHRGFMDREGRWPGAEPFVGDTEVVLPQLADLVADRRGTSTMDRSGPPGREAPVTTFDPDGPISLDALAHVSYRAIADGPWQLAHGLLKGAVRRHWDLSTFNCHLGGSGGGGLGYGPGASIGAALASTDDDRLIVALQPDGDFLYTASALWTMARESLPILIIMVNNRTYGQDRMHQETMSRLRERPIEHAAVGIDIDDPAIDFAALATSQGVEGLGPVSTLGELERDLHRAARTVRSERRPVLVDVLVG